MTRTRTLAIFFIAAALLLILVAWARAESKVTPIMIDGQQYDWPLQGETAEIYITSAREQGAQKNITIVTGPPVTYHLVHKIRTSDNLPSLIRVVSSTGKAVLEAQWREKGTEREPGYELWERLSAFRFVDEAHTLLHTWPICAGNARCGEISQKQLEKALGRDLDAVPMQTSTSVVMWK